jgi:hypothetical protein
MRVKLILMVVLCLVGCGKDSPKAPAAAKLLYDTADAAAARV